eukprot:gene9983-biopygen9295
MTEHPNVNVGMSATPNGGVVMGMGVAGHTRIGKQKPKSCNISWLSHTARAENTCCPTSYAPRYAKSGAFEDGVHPFLQPARGKRQNMNGMSQMRGRRRAARAPPGLVCNRGVGGMYPGTATQATQCVVNLKAPHRKSSLRCNLCFRIPYLDFDGIPKQSVRARTPRHGRPPARRRGCSARSRTASRPRRWRAPSRSTSPPPPRRPSSAGAFGLAGAAAPPPPRGSREPWGLDGAAGPPRIPGIPGSAVSPALVSRRSWRAGHVPLQSFQRGAGTGPARNGD